MSESTTSPAVSRADSPGGGGNPRGGGKKILGMNRTTVIIFGVVLAGAVGWFLWKRHQASTAAAAPATTGPANASGDCTDASGNSVPCDEDFAGQLSALQTEVESLLGEGAGVTGAAGGGSAGGSTGTTGTTGGDGTADTTGATGTTPTSTTTTTAPASPAAAAPKATVPTQVTGLHATTVTQTSIGLAWTKATRATSYQVRVTYQSNVVGTHNLGNVNSYTVTGLTRNHTYGLHVVAINSAGQAPEASISQKTKP